MTSNNSDTKKYLTEIKELPGYEDEVGTSLSEASSQDNNEDIELSRVSNNISAKNIDSVDKTKKEVNQTEESELESETGVKLTKTKPDKVKKIAGVPFTPRDIILNSINILTLVLLIVILMQLNSKAEELNSLKSENVRLSENYNYNMDQVEENLQKAQELSDLFANDSEVIDFVSDVENLRDSGAIRSVRFSSPDPVIDRSGSYGRPIIIDLRGNWQQIDQAIDDIHSLPYLFRPVKVQIGEQESTDGILEVNYGGLLYIEDPVN